MTNEEKLILNYNFVKGAQMFLKEAGLLKYANEELENSNADALAQAMIHEGVNAPADKAMEDNSVLEIANALLELAKSEEGETKTKLEDAAHDVATAVAPEVSPLAEEKKMASEMAKKLAAAGDATTPKPDQVLSISDTDYTREKGKTTLDTSKGQIGANEDEKAKHKEQKSPEYSKGQNVESKDITEKDYTVAVGKSNLNTAKGQIGAEETKKIAKLALEVALAKVLNK